MTRAATTHEVAKFAGDFQRSKLYAVILSPVTVFAAQMDGDVQWDKLNSVSFDTVTTGAYTDILPGMTVLFGSSAGAHDLGIGMARKNATATKLYLSETSEVTALDNDYITVIRDFGPWPIRSRQDSFGTFYTNFDDAFTTQYSAPRPVIIAGGDRVLELAGATVACTLALSDSYMPDGSSIASYATTCPGSTVTNGTTNAPTLTFDAAGEYLVKIIVTGTNTAVSITYRWVVVWDATNPPKNILMNDNSGDMDGWSASMTLYENQSAVRDRAKVLLFEKASYIHNDVQTLRIGGSGLGGTFTLNFAGQTTGAISWSATNATLLANIDAALEALSNIGAGEIACAALSLTAGIGTLTITFSGALDTPNLPLLLPVSSLTGTAPTLSVIPSGADGSIGSLTGCENIVIPGWIAGDSIDYDIDGGGVKFDVKPASYFLNNEQSMELAFTKATTPATWLQVAHLSVDTLLILMSQYFSTLSLFSDLIITGDTREIPSLTVQIGTVWGQIQSICEYIKANAIFNQYGQLICRIDTPLIPIADRSGIPIVVTLTKDDFESISVEITQAQPCAQILLTSMLANGGVVASIGGGHMPDRFGSITELRDLMAATQTQSNVLAGSIFERENVRYKFSITNLRGANRLIEPSDRIGLVMEAGDNLQGIAYSGYAIVRGVQRNYDNEKGEWSIDLDADMETQAIRYCDGDIAGTDNNNDSFPRFLYPPFPPLTIPVPPAYPTPPGVPVAPSGCIDASPGSGPYTLQWSRPWIDGSADPALRSMFAMKACTVRSLTADYPTRIEVQFSYTGLAYDHVNIFGVDGAGNRVCTADVAVDFAGNGYAQITATFSEVSPIVVAGFEMNLDEGYDTTPATLIDEGHSVVGPYEAFQGATLTTTRDIYDSAGGHIRYTTTGSGLNHNSVLNYTLDFYQILSSDVGATGFTYVSIFFLGTSSGKSLELIGPTGKIAETSFTGMLFIKDGEVEDHPNFRISSVDYLSYADYGTITLIIDFYFSGTVPARALAPLPGALYNVCPVETVA